jgi:tetratricopeptide (TPR) repeat protein
MTGRTTGRGRLVRDEGFWENKMVRFGRVSWGLLGGVIVSSLLVAALSACWRPAGIGVGGNYNDAVLELGKTQRGGNVRKAIVHLEYVVRGNPKYKDSLTQLGRAYYYAGRYGSSFEVLKRALAVNREDEIGWIVLGLTQMQRGDDEVGLGSFKGGLSLLAKATQDGYKEIPEEFWDTRGVVRRALRRSISLARKGVSEKRRIIQSGELLLHRVDGEIYDAEQYQSQSEYIDSLRDRKRDN